MLSLNVNSISKSSRVTGADLPFQSNEATTNQLSGLINNLYLQKSMVVKRNHYSWEFGPFVLESCWCLVSVWFVFMQILTPRGVTVLSKCEREMPSVCTSCNQGQHQISLRTAPYSDTPSFQHSARQPGIRKSQQNPLVWSGVYMGLICFIWKLLNIEIADSCIQLSSPWLICVPGLWQTCKQWLTGDGSTKQESTKSLDSSKKFRICRSRWFWMCWFQFVCQHAVSRIGCPGVESKSQTIWIYLIHFAPFAAWR